MPSKRSGFTLVELSIVILILGLLVGGILVGKDMVHAAEIRKQIGQFEEYKGAYDTFKTKYDCVPGDCSKPNLFNTLPGDTWAYYDSVHIGNGDGRITNRFQTTYDDWSDWWPDDGELRYFFIELEQAGLVKDHFTTNLGVGQSIPATKLNAGAGFFAQDSKAFVKSNRNPDISGYATGVNILWFAGCDLVDNSRLKWDMQCGIFSTSDMDVMDTKIDDGLPLSGNFFGFGGPDFTNNNNNCLNGTAYDLTRKGNQCQAAYILE